MKNKYFCYRFFGLNIYSEIELPIKEKYLAVPDVNIFLNKNIKIKDNINNFILPIKNLAEYYISDGNKIIVKPLSDDLDKIIVFLMGTAMGILLQQRGLFTIHASGVKINNQAILICGDSGAGKSTLAGTFLKQGFKLLGDDTLAMNIENNKIIAKPGYSFIKLHDDSFNYIGKNFLKDRIINQVYNKSRIAVTNQFFEDPLEVANIFVLEKDQKINKIKIFKINGVDKFNLLMKNTYRLNFYKKQNLMGTHFKMCSFICNNVDMFKLIRPDSYFSGEELIAKISHRVMQSCGV